MTKSSLATVLLTSGVVTVEVETLCAPMKEMDHRPAAWPRSPPSAPRPHEQLCPLLAGHVISLSGHCTLSLDSAPEY